MSGAEDPQAARSPQWTTPARGRLVIAVAAVMWSTSGFFAKAPLFDDWDPSRRGIYLAFWRAVFASAVLLPFVRRLSFTWMMVPMTLCFAAMNVTFLGSMVMTTAANTIWLQHTAPAWVFLVSATLLRERVTRRDWVLLAFAAAGVMTILAGELRGQAMMGVILGLASGLLYAGVVLCLRVLREHDSAWLVSMNHVVTALILLPLVIAAGNLPVGQQWLYLAAFGMFQMGLPYLMFAWGLRSVTGHEASGIVLLEPLLVPLWVWLAWHNSTGYEAPRWWTLLGGGLILTGLVIRYLAGRSVRR